MDDNLDSGGRFGVKMGSERGLKGPQGGSKSIPERVTKPRAVLSRKNVEKEVPKGNQKFQKSSKNRGRNAGGEQQLLWGGPI